MNSCKHFRFKGKTCNLCVVFLYPCPLCVSYNVTGYAGAVPKLKLRPRKCALAPNPSYSTHLMQRSVITYLWGAGGSSLFGSCEILCPVGTVTLDSPHPGFDPTLSEECDPSGGRLVHESLEISSLLLLLRPNNFKPLFFPNFFTKGHNAPSSQFVQVYVVALVYLWIVG